MDWGLNRARKELADIFARIIQTRRESKAQEDDILQSFIDSRYEKVRLLHLSRLVIAGHVPLSPR